MLCVLAYLIFGTLITGMLGFALFCICSAFGWWRGTLIFLGVFVLATSLVLSMNYLDNNCPPEPPINCEEQPSKQE